jgi:hypothetical protein
MAASNTQGWEGKAGELKQLQNYVAILDAEYENMLKSLTDHNISIAQRKFTNLHLRMNRQRKSDFLSGVSKVFNLDNPPVPPDPNGGRKNRSKTKRNNKRIKIIRNKYNKRTKNRRYKSKK